MDSKREKELKDLSQLIVSALTRDEAVMSALADLKKRKVIEASTLLGLALKINDLLELSTMAVSDVDGNQAEGKMERINAALTAKLEKETKSAGKLKVMIDGRELTYEEILFEEWASAHFNEKEWLKKTGLIW